ncbi:hypothetical protein [Fodinibius sediminis]|uniref:Uncharacterized protein n=1 Tax=Fodinibius sediminis TaxID=1214077 RepID=A0A521DTW1_9BACT|nr:hypothetical protein [Fodinibius sediminis]SMO75137.1 hypothetical protein SAMN06265218_111139 [Fodinibius sediminis]
MSPFEKPYETQEKEDLEWEIIKLPVVDDGYYDTLAAIGFGALADSYYDTPNTPIIKWTQQGYRVHYVKELRPTPDLQWLKYSLAASWKSSLDDGVTKIAKGWDKETRIEHKGVVVDTSEKPTIQVEIGGKKREMTDPDRTLYGVINKLGKPDWVNLCISACRERGLELLDGDFEEKSVTLNSIVFPQSSKGANSKSSYSIGNSSMPKSFSRPLSRLTCLAVAGLCFSAIGESPTGFAVPMPLDMRVEIVRELAIANRKRYYYGGFFFPYNNYLRLVKLLKENPADFKVKIEGLQKLKGVTGINFVELGNSASPAGTWKLLVPSHKYSLESVDKLQKLLVRWRRAKIPRPGSDPSIDRKAVRTLMNGFEASNPQSAAEGYLQYLDAVGLGGNYINLLNQTFFEEIMAHSSKYQELLEEFKTEEIQRFIQLLRQDTIQKVYSSNGKKDPPNYQVIRRLREIQSPDDFMEAITEIAVERGSNKLASSQSSGDSMQYMSLPYEGSLEKLITLAEDDRFTPRLIAQLLLSFALSTQKSKEEAIQEN